MMVKRSLVAGILGIVLGFFAAKLLFLQWLTLIPWGIAAFLLGYFAGDRRVAIATGASYGFLLGLVFMIGQYSGADPLITKIPAFALLGIVSAICAVVLCLLGYLVRQTVLHRS